MIETNDLIFEYRATSFEPGSNVQPDGFTALNGVNITVEQGEFVAVLGHNGSGKSTFAKHINVLLRPSSGKVHVDGLDTADDANVWLIRQHAGMVFQNPDNQLIATIVEDDVAFGPENLCVESEQIRQRVDWALGAVDMAEAKRRPPHLLSGGQKQRIAIAGILAMRPACIVLDEPTAMLDPIGRREVMRTISRLNREDGMTIVLITHYMDEAAQADRVIVMEKGSVMMDGAPAQVFTQIERLRELGLEAPQTTEVCSGLAKLGIPIDTDILTIEEMVEAIDLSGNHGVSDLRGNFSQGKELTTPRTRSGSLGESDDELRKIDRKDGIAGLPVRSNMQGQETAIECKGLGHTYSPGTPFAKRALDNITLSVEKGSFVGLIGHTGSGKSTLIQHFNALLAPSEGTILINGRDIHADKKILRETRQNVGLVFQYPEHQLFEVTVYKDVAFGPENMGLPKDDVDARVRKALSLVNIGEEHFEKSPFELSGGQKRRVAIAGVLAMQPSILILDEPTAGLDPRGRNTILSTIKNMHDELGITVVLVSHSMEDIAKYVSKIIVMHDGTIFKQGTREEVFADAKALENIGLNAPAMSRLFQELRARGLDLPQTPFTTEDATRILYQYLKPLGD